MSEAGSDRTAGFHFIAKPAGPACNYDCHYCYYTEKRSLFARVALRRMNDALLERFIYENIAAQPGPDVWFTWQGGEPTLCGRRFFERALALQERYRPAGWRINNAFQTHGGLLDKDWAKFLHDAGFLVGLSIDGPRDLHDAGRRDRRGRGTFAKSRRAVDLLRDHGVEFNTLTVVHAHNWERGTVVYRFLRRIGVRHMQFIPHVERIGRCGALAGPPTGQTSGFELSPWTAPPEGYGRFLCTVFDEWCRKDVGRVSVQIFDLLVGRYLGHPSTLCVFAESCGRGPVLEHNGDVFACDHYVYPQYRLGNMLRSSLARLATGRRQQEFGRAKRAGLPSDCRCCPHLALCFGGCPKHRFCPAADGTSRLNYLCPSYRMVFAHTATLLQRVACDVGCGRPPRSALRERGSRPAASRRRAR